MAYLHCHHCGWEQDDFWSKHYNPIRCLLDWEKDLLSSKLDEPFTDDAGFIREHGNLTLRGVIAQELERAARKVRKMVYPTEADFKNAGENRWKCPQCGKGLCID